MHNRNRLRNGEKSVQAACLTLQTLFSDLNPFSTLPQKAGFCRFSLFRDQWTPIQTQKSHLVTTTKLGEIGLTLLLEFGAQGFGGLNDIGLVFLGVLAKGLNKGN